MIASKSLLQGLTSTVRSSYRSLRSDFARFADKPVAIPMPALQKRGPRTTVSACIDELSVYFSSADVSLRPSPEAYGCALLIPSLHSARSLVIEPPVCEIWAESFASIPSFLKPWWNYSPTQLALNACHAPSPRLASRALAFSCGADSFFSLFQYPHRLDALVGVLGFDVKLRDRNRTSSLSDSVRAVAAEFGMKSIIVSTNLRKLRLIRRPTWERTNGGALAAIGHLLSDEYGTFVISSSVAKEINLPCGSHWELDPRFGSASMVVDHFGEFKMRSLKLMDIATEPIVQKHLRVCWEFRNKSANCGVCEKCIRTMLTLDMCGQLGNFHTFTRTNRLVDSIQKIEYVPKLTIDPYELLLRMGVSPEYRSAVEKLLERSKQHHGIRS